MHQPQQRERRTQGVIVRPLHGFGLKDSILKKVYAENARRILKMGRSQ